MSLPSRESFPVEFNPFGVELHSPEALAQRLALVPAGDSVRGYLFQDTLEQVRLRGSGEAVRRCIDASGLEAPIAFFKYPISALLRLLYQAAWELRGRASFEETLYGLGHHVCGYFLRNAVGRSFLMMGGKNPRRLVEAMPMGYRTTWEHGRVSLQWMGPRHCRSTLQGGVIPPPYLEGIIQHAFEAAGVVGSRVKARPLSLSETEFDLTWE